MTEPTHPIHVDLTIDLDRYLAGVTRYDRDGEPYASGPTTLEAVVLDAVVAQIIHVFVDNRDLSQPLRERVAKVRDEVIREAVQPLVVEALESALQPTSRYGEPAGDPTTLRSVIVAEAQSYLTKAQHARYGDEAVTPVKQMIREEVAKAVKADLKEALEQARAEVSAAVQAEAAVLLAETIKRAAVRL